VQPWLTAEPLPGAIVHTIPVLVLQEDEHDEDDDEDEQVWQPTGDDAGAHSDMEADSQTEAASALTGDSEPEPTSWFSRVWRALRGVKPDPTGVRLVWHVHA